MTSFALAATLITIRRATSYVLDSVAIAASLTPNRQPSSASRILVYASGSPTGTVTLTGTVGGVTDTEALTWTGAAGARVTVKTFSAVTSFTSTLTGGSTIYAQAVGAGGQPEANKLVDVLTGFPASLIQKNQPGWKGLAAGHEETADAVAKLTYLDVYTPAEGDLLTADTGDTYEVKSAHLRGGALRPGEWILVLQKRQGRV